VQDADERPGACGPLVGGGGVGHLVGLGGGDGGATAGDPGDADAWRGGGARSDPLVPVGPGVAGGGGWGGGGGGRGAPPPAARRSRNGPPATRTAHGLNNRTDSPNIHRYPCKGDGGKVRRHGRVWTRAAGPARHALPPRDSAWAACVSRCAGGVRGVAETIFP